MDGGDYASYDNLTNMDIFLGHGPGGTSYRNIEHFAQGIN